MDYSALSEEHKTLTPEQIVELPEYQAILATRQKLPEGIQRLFGFIDYLYMNKVSNAHVHPDKPVRHDIQDVLRLDQDSDYSLFVEEEIQEWANYGRKESDRKRVADLLETQGHASVAIDTDFARVRATFRHSMQGLSASFRVIPREVPTPEMLDVPETIQTQAKRRSGLIYVCGPSGSGKSTLNHSLLGKINRENNRHIYTLEDPIEYIHEEVDATSIVQREIGSHSPSYSAGIADALRSKPHVILVAEILNAEDARAVLRAASTGHLVLTTAHAGSVRESIESFVAWFPPEEQEQTRRRFADVLLTAVVQKLIPRTDDTLLAVREILTNTPNTADAIRNDRLSTIQQLIASNAEPDSTSMEQSLANAVREDLISLPVAQSFARDVKALNENLSQIHRGEALSRTKTGFFSR
ncbi:type IV pilus twitching motility protein PilT [Glutamicibacter ardleyensis]|uniref:type IV pilus twitching motility protein PilT n=1 Tax=Glutamicibacter ardleyensis TaxID=225894 RepID=UPI003FD627D3